MSFKSLFHFTSSSYFFLLRFLAFNFSPLQPTHFTPPSMCLSRQPKLMQITSQVSFIIIGKLKTEDSLSIEKGNRRRRLEENFKFYEARRARRRSGKLFFLGDCGESIWKFLQKFNSKFKNCDTCRLNWKFTSNVVNDINKVIKIMNVQFSSWTSQPLETMNGWTSSCASSVATFLLCVDEVVKVNESFMTWKKIFLFVLVVMMRSLVSNLAKKIVEDDEEEVLKESKV